MDERRFDGLAKLLGASTARRGALGVLAALGASGAVGLFGADAKGKGKGGKKNTNKGNKRNCPAKAKPACAASACQAAVCDRRRGKWSCRNTCAGTSKPKCLGGQCVDACDEELGLTECGDQCCNPLVHSECCQGTCCPIGQRCKNGQCVKSCETWGDITGGKLEYEIIFWARRNEVVDGVYLFHEVDDTITATADLECYYNAFLGEIACRNLGGVTSGTHSAQFEEMHPGWSEPLVYSEEGSGGEDLPAQLWPHLAIHLPESSENPATYEVTAVTIGVEGTSTRYDEPQTFYIPGGFDSSLWASDFHPLPATPQTLSGTDEREMWPWDGPHFVRLTWTFTPDGC
jgi:hypothetical protein